MGYFSQAGSLLTSVIFGILILIVMLRLLMQAVRADFHNPLSQGIYRLTNPMIVPFRKFVPAYRSVDLPTIVLLLLLQYLMLTLLNLISGAELQLLRNFVEAPFGLFNLLLNIYLFSILIMVIVSWIQPGGGYNPVLGLINQIIHPIMLPIKKRIATAGGFDISPMVAIILITLVKMAIPFLYIAVIKTFGFAYGAFDIAVGRY
ncbi:Integral membrane protein YggT, involved in response to extracytoplasmic stress (osmotic shock) [hydrothermal vent metagenome]|uniref:Integral membrane protein YggT, involved in response to extracytoplasmic stress (Osmotic shock) n=1 Tax=hydrothermal vent metagenome TaxID=652676 RepID=A0A3B0YJR5_9ZZZZ